VVAVNVISTGSAAVEAMEEPVAAGPVEEVGGGEAEGEDDDEEGEEGEEDGAPDALGAVA
jgi:hypothetical protein